MTDTTRLPGGSSFKVTARPITPATGAPTPATKTLAPSTPATTSKTDAFSTTTPPKTAEIPANAGALAAGDSRLGRSTALVDMILSADKTSFVDKKTAAEGAAAAAALGDRDLAKRVGLILQTSPYGAPQSVLLSRLQADPVIAARFPKLTRADLQELHARFPAVVPPPHNPVDMGAAYSPSQEGYLDLYASMFVRANGRFEHVAQAFPGTGGVGDYVRTRFSPSGTPGLGLGDNSFPALHTIMSKADATKEGLTRVEFFLRRAILNAPAHWSAADIAAEHNRYVEYHAPLLFNGNTQAELDAAKARALLTPDQVLDTMTKNPVKSGASELNTRRAALRETVLAAMRAASPSDNLYEVFDRIAGALTDKSQRAPEHNVHAHSRHLVFERPPGPDATLTAEDLVAFVSGDQALAPELDRLMGERKSGLDKRLAQAIAAKFGPRLSRTSVSEITRTMKKESPVYNEALVQHLIATFPKIFGAARIETGRVEVNFLLAQQVADAMDKMFTGASLEDVAKFLRSKGPEFTSAYPDFSAEDVRLLQAAFPFLPQWESKTEGAAPGTSDRMPLESLLKFASRQLGAKDAKALQGLVLAGLASPDATEKVPPGLLAEVDRFFGRGLMALVADAAGVSNDQLSTASLNKQGGGAEHKAAMSQRDVFAKFLDLDPNANLDHATVTRIVANPNLAAIPEARAGQIATALIQARAGDLDGLYETASSLFASHPKLDTLLTQLTNQMLGREALVSRMERDVFANKELRASFQRFARIPLRLPMIQHVVEKYKDEQPLAGHNVLMVQHMLGQAYPQINGYKQLGMDPKQCIFVGIPYHKNEEVEQAVAKSFGVDVRVPPRDMDELYKAIERGVDDVVAQHKKNGKPVLIVCDGPHARDYFKKKYPELSSAVRFTEQTAFGDRPEYRNDTSMRVVSYARTDLKQKREAKFIGQAVARAINAVLTQLGTGYEEKPVLILGYGSIGQATAEALGGDRAKIYVYDPYIKPEQEAEAKANGYTVVKDKSQIAAGKFMMVGCSGHLSIDESQIMSSDPNAIYVSASSKLVEIDMRKLKELATDAQGRVRKILAAEVNDQQTWHYWLKDGTIRTVIADGLPANFNDINSVPPEFIDMTMSLSLAAAVQATSDKSLGYASLNAADADELVGLYDGMVEQMHAEAREAAAREQKPAASATPAQPKA